MKMRPLPRHLAVFAALSTFAAIAVAKSTSVVTPHPAKEPRQRPQPGPPVPPPRPAGQFGDPLPGLTAAQLAEFTAGLNQFNEVDTVASGLGPIFNDNSCAACHTDGAIGGGSTRTVTRFGRTTKGVFDPLTELGGSLLQAKAIDPRCQEVIPGTANVTALRKTTPLFGAGLIEAIPDNAILQLAKRVRPDGIKGKAAMIVDVATGLTRVGRFGWKAQHSGLLSFAGDAYVNEMGITNRLFPDENAPNGDQALLEEFDTVADPEDVTDSTGKADIDRFADFMQLLAPPPTLPPTNSSRAGADIFMLIGCAQCHVPVQFTGPNVIAALDRKPVNLFSDLLLHDMGTLDDGIAQGAAGTNQMKTPPLWGLRVRTVFLHDGSAATIDAAIRAHSGEGAKSRDRYLKRPAAQQQHLVDFLNSI